MRSRMVAIYVPDNQLEVLAQAKIKAEEAGKSFSAWLVELMARSVAQTKGRATN